MNRIHLIAAATALGLAAATPATAKVNVIQSPSAALARGSTFAWAPTPAVGYGVLDPRLANEVTADRLRAVTEITFTNKGYRLVDDPATAALLVSYIVVIVRENGEAGDGGSDLKSPTQGTLVLDIVDRQAGTLVLRATSEKRVTIKDVSQETLVALLEQMTKSLPK